MKRLKRLIATVVVIIVGLILFAMFTYSTKENQYAVVKRFGKITNITSSAGLNAKAPLIDSVSYIPKSIQFYDLAKSEVITSDKKTMIVDAYILWKVTEPKAFTQTLNASTKTAEGRIDVIVYNAIKTTISSMTQEELIASREDNLVIANSDSSFDDLNINDFDDEISTSGDNSEVDVIDITDRLLACIGTQCDQYGVEITDVQIKVLDLPNENKVAVYNRMITERNNIAAAYQAQGESEATIIRNTTDKETNIMRAEAEAQANAIIAEGEAEYMKILADAYNDEDKAEFYLYTRSLDFAKESLMNGNTTLFIDSDNPIAQVFQGSN